MFKNKEIDGSESDLANIDAFIGPSSVVEGSLTTDSQGCICIDGGLKGSLESQGRVVVTRAGSLEADIVAEYITVHGTVVGNITARKQFELGSTGKIKGSVEAGMVSIASGGVLDGFCKMLPLAETASKPDKPEKETGGKDAGGRNGLDKQAIG